MSKRITVIKNAGRAVRVELMAYAGIAAAVGAVWWGVELLQTYGLRPGDGGVLRPFEDRLLVAGITSGCGIAIAIGLLIYQSLYVVGLVLVGDQFDVHSKVGFFNVVRTYKTSDVTSSTYRHNPELDFGRGGPNVPREYAMTFRIRGRWLPYILDLNAKFVDRGALFRIAPDAVRIWNSASPPQNSQ